MEQKVDIHFHIEDTFYLQLTTIVFESLYRVTIFNTSFSHKMNGIMMHKVNNSTTLTITCYT